MRRKDKIREKKEVVQKKRDLGKSRLFLQQEEKTKEIQLLEKVKKLPDDLIRVIFSYMSGKARFICNYKFNYLNSGVYKDDIYLFINNLPKKDLLDFIHKGILRKHPNIIENVDGNFYCRDIQQFSKLKGYRLIQEWESNNLVYDNDSQNSIEENDVEIGEWIKYAISDEMEIYIYDIIALYKHEKTKINTKKRILRENTLFLDLDKAFYFYKCVERFMMLKKKNIPLAPPPHSIPLIPAPLYI